MSKKKINWFVIIFWAIIIILTIMILTRIFGNSATDVQIYITLIMGMLVIMGYIVKGNREIGEIKVGMQYIISTGVKEGFTKIKEDMSLIKKKLKI